MRSLSDKQTASVMLCCLLAVLLFSDSVTDQITQAKCEMYLYVAEVHVWHASSRPSSSPGSFALLDKTGLETSVGFKYSGQ